MKIGDFISKYWKHPIALFLYAIIIILIVYNWGKVKGSFKGKKPPKDTDSGKGLTDQESEQVSLLVGRLYRDMDSYMVSSGFKDRDVDAYKQLLGLDDRMFISVYNYFGELYFKEGNGTLREWIDGESFTFTTGASGDLREAILEKMDKLSLGE